MRRFLNREKKYKLTEEEANKNAAKDRSVFWNIYVCEVTAQDAAWGDKKDDFKQFTKCALSHAKQNR